MEMYYGSCIDDLVVPKDVEFPPSSDTWFKWGKSAPHSFGSGNNYFVMGSHLTQDELNSNGKRCSSRDPEMTASIHSKGHTSDSRSVRGAFSDSLDDFLGIGDVFMSSLLDDLPATESFHKSDCISPGSPKSPESFMVDSQNSLRDVNSMRSSKYAKTDDIFCWENREVTPSTSDWESMKVPQVEHFSFSEGNSTGGYVDEEASIEEFVLQDLEIVMTQLTEKTRICFRDALYRLAKNSKQQTEADNSPFMEETTAHDDETTRPEAMESESNTIDRAVANLMYSEMESNVSDILFTAAPNLEQEALSGDAEVPIHNVREESTSGSIPG